MDILLFCSIQFTSTAIIGKFREGKSEKRSKKLYYLKKPFDFKELLLLDRHSSLNT